MSEPRKVTFKESKILNTLCWKKIKINKEVGAQVYKQVAKAIARLTTTRKVGNSRLTPDASS